MNELYNVKLGVLTNMNRKVFPNLKWLADTKEINIWAKDDVEAVKLFIYRLIIEDGYEEENLIFISCNKDVNA